MKRLRCGTMLFLATVLLSSCRKSPPPQIDICIGDGFGGADCVMKDGSEKYIGPSGLTNFWMTNQNDMASFSAWCYQTSVETTQKTLTQMQNRIRYAPH